MSLDVCLGGRPSHGSPCLLDDSRLFDTLVRGDVRRTFWNTPLHFLAEDVCYGAPVKKFKKHII